jgi:hypothetical protein
MSPRHTLGGLIALVVLVPAVVAEETAKTGIAAVIATATATIDRSDGVDAAEAQLLASVYFGLVISGCGGIGMVRAGEDGWIAESRVGIAGAPGPLVSVSRDGRLVRAEGYLTVRFVDDGVVVEPAVPARAADAP